VKLRKQAGQLLFNRWLCPPSDSSLRLRRGEEDYGHAYLYDEIFGGDGSDESVVTKWCPPGSRCLDLGGGTGRIALGLVRAGRNVTLVDNSDSMLAVAKKKRSTLSDGLGQRWMLVKQDLARLELTGRFDRVFALCNSLAHLKSLEEMRLALARLGPYLETDAELLIDVHHSEYWSKTKGWGTKTWRYSADIRREKLRARVWRRTSEASVPYQVRWEHAVSHYGWRFRHLESLIYVMPKDRWLALFEVAGFQIEAIAGNWEFAPLRETHPVMILKMKLKKSRCPAQRAFFPRCPRR
jgi:SAM-dependent methyltransferase